MAKSKSEIQKAYRERQKAKGKSFLEKERLRQQQYYTPAAKLGHKKRAKRNEKNKLRNRLCRAKKHLQQQGAINAIEDTSGYETFNHETEEENAAQSTSDITSQNSSTPLIVKLPALGQNVRKRNAKALSRAYREIESLKSEIETLKRQSRSKSKKIERLKNKKEAINQQPETESMTPKRKTMADVEMLKLTPKRQKRIKRQLLTSNVLMHEIEEAKKASGKKKVHTIHRIIAGKLAKKYRCLKSIGRGIHMCRRALSKADKKSLETRKEQRKSLSKEFHDNVVEFFNREDNSRTQPGKADAKKVGGEKDKVQTKVLTDYLKNLHCKYSSEYPETKMSLSTFTRLRPTNVLLASFMSRNTCQCLHHQNMALKVQALRKCGLRISENPENIMIHANAIDELLSNLPTKISYKRWEKADIGNGKMKMMMVDKEDDKEKFKTDLISQINLFEQHVQRVREQYHQVRILKENLPENEVMLQMDFAENYSCRSQNEVQTAYWNQTMVTIHPSVAYFRENGELNHKSFLVISDEMSHSASTVCTFLDKIIPHLKIIKPGLRVIHYWTDSPSSQYRNRYIFHALINHPTMFGIRARWNYFEVGHGKGPCDGLGGTAKRMADAAVKQGRVNIQNAKDFFTWGSNSSMKAKFVFVSTDETRKKQEEIALIKTKPLKGTMRLHAVGASSDGKSMMTRETSCYCAVCLSGSYCNTWKPVEFKCVNAKEAVEIENEPMESSVTHTGNETLNNANEETSSAESVQIPKAIDIGIFVAAVYDNAWFIGRVVDKDPGENEYEIEFMERAKEMFKWPSSDDRIWVGETEVLCAIESLKPSGKSKRLFKLDLEEKEKVNALFSATKL